jgi:hypothetical protein
MEVLQMLKFHLKKDHLNFTEGWVTTDDEMKLKDDPKRGADKDPLGGWRSVYHYNCKHQMA